MKFEMVLSEILEGTISIILILIVTRDQFKYCFDAYFDSIRNYLYFRSGNSELANDISQEVFMKIWEKKLEYNPSKIKGLLYKMAGDRFIDHFRKNKVAQTYQDSLEFQIVNEDPQTMLQYDELKNKYEKALGKLPETQRSVFLMSRMESLTYKEIAERLELSVKAVEKRMSKALSALKLVMNY